MGSGFFELPPDPAFLFLPEQGSLGLIPTCTVSRIHAAPAKTITRRAGLGITKLTVIKCVERRQTSVSHAGKDARIFAATLDQLRKAGAPDRHMFIKRLIGSMSARHEIGDGFARITLLRACIVILDLVVIPGDDPRIGRMGGLQVQIGLVERIAAAVSGKRVDPSTGGWTHLGGTRDWILIDVVAQKQDKVQSFVQHMPVGAVVTVAPLLARGIGQSQSVHRRIDRGKCLRPAGRADGA